MDIALVSKEAHGFPFVPIAYHRDDEGGACWTPSQESIEGLRAFVFPNGTE